MTDYTELKKLAEAAGSGEWGYDGSYVCPVRRDGGTRYVETWRSIADCHQPDNTKFIAAANPSAVLALIAENEAMSNRLFFVDIVHGPKAETRWKALSDEAESLRKDAERFRYIQQDADSGMRRIYGDDWVSVIDANGFQK